MVSRGTTFVRSYLESERAPLEEVSRQIAEYDAKVQHLHDKLVRLVRELHASRDRRGRALDRAFAGDGGLASFLRAELGPVIDRADLRKESGIHEVQTRVLQAVQEWSLREHGMSHRFVAEAEAFRQEALARLAEILGETPRVSLEDDAQLDVLGLIAEDRDRRERRGESVVTPMGLPDIARSRGRRRGDEHRGDRRRDSRNHGGGGRGPRRSPPCLW